MDNEKSFIKLLGKGLWKKLKQLLKFIRNILVLLIVFATAMVVTTLVYERTDESGALKTVEGLRIEEIDYFYTDGMVDNSTMNEIDVFINKQPAYIKNKFYQQNWKIVILDAPPKTMITEIVLLNTKDGDVRTLQGLTSPSIKTIFLNNGDFAQGDVYSSFIHEFGHYVDFINGYPSLSSKFLDLYEKNKYNTFYSEHAKSNSSEFFAESYTLFMLNPTLMEGEAPDIYNYLDEMVGEMATINDSVAKKYVTGTVGMVRRGIATIRDIIDGLI